jgi:hypothetical protein
MFVELPSGLTFNPSHITAIVPCQGGGEVWCSSNDTPFRLDRDDFDRLLSTLTGKPADPSMNRPTAELTLPQWLDCQAAYYRSWQGEARAHELAELLAGIARSFRLRKCRRLIDAVMLEAYIRADANGITYSRPVVTDPAPALEAI